MKVISSASSSEFNQHNRHDGQCRNILYIGIVLIIVWFDLEFHTMKLVCNGTNYRDCQFCECYNAGGAITTIHPATTTSKDSVGKILRRSLLSDVPVDIATSSLVSSSETTTFSHTSFSTKSTKNNSTKDIDSASNNDDISEQYLTPANSKKSDDFNQNVDIEEVKRKKLFWIGIYLIMISSIVGIICILILFCICYEATSKQHDNKNENNELSDIPQQHYNNNFIIDWVVGCYRCICYYCYDNWNRFMNRADPTSTQRTSASTITITEMDAATTTNNNDDDDDYMIDFNQIIAVTTSGIWKESFMINHKPPPIDAVDVSSVENSTTTTTTNVYYEKYSYDTGITNRKNIISDGKNEKMNSHQNVGHNNNNNKKNLIPAETNTCGSGTCFKVDDDHYNSNATDDDTLTLGTNEDHTILVDLQHHYTKEKSGKQEMDVVADRSCPTTDMDNFDYYYDDDNTWYDVPL